MEYDEDGCCPECGKEEATPVDPACDICNGRVRNGLTVGDFTFDVFIAADGELGITVYKPGQDPNDNCPIVDIFVDKDDLSVKSW
jgi:hypothetical protein